MNHSNSVAHLDDEERQLVLGVVLEEILSYARGLPGTQELKTLVVFDEVYGYLPPHPANPPTKRPIVSLMKQARAFGMGVVIATLDGTRAPRATARTALLRGA